MKSRLLPLVALISAIVLVSIYVSASYSYRDVLDLPSVPSKNASKSLLVGVALAGKRIVAVGQFGHIVYSDDQGASWTQASVPVSSDLVAVHFPTPQKGWAVGHDGVVLQSADGGTTWNKQLDGRGLAKVVSESYPGLAIAQQDGGHRQGPAEDLKKIAEEGPNKPFLDVWFENENTGYIVGAFGLIFRTADGGRNWTSWYDRIDNPKHFHLYAIRPVGKTLFITAEQGTVFRMEEKTGRFEAIKTPYTGTFFGITGKPGEPLAFGMRGNAYISRDNGVGWQKVETGVPVGLMASAVTEEGKIVLVSQGGDVLVWDNEHTKFDRVKTKRQFPAAGVATIDKNRITLVGMLGVKVQSIE